jgi:hypothetical protein
MSPIVKQCANHKPGEACPRKATPGHVFCNPCRLAHGGYNRTRPSLSRDANDRR